MIENSEQLGTYFLDQLTRIKSDRIKEVRGRGLMLAIELHHKEGSAQPYVRKLKERGILAKDTHGTTIRISPPLVITRDQIDWAVEQIDSALA